MLAPPALASCGSWDEDTNDTAQHACQAGGRRLEVENAGDRKPILMLSHLFAGVGRQKRRRRNVCAYVKHTNPITKGSDSVRGVADEC